MSKGPRALAAALLIVVPALLWSLLAQAATTVVTLTGNGPSPASVTIQRGDTVTFRNSDDVTHRVRRTSGGWAFDVSVPAGGSVSTPAFGAAGTYGYEDSYTIALLVQRFDGSITVKAPAPTRSPSARPTSSRSAAPRPSASRSPSPSPSPTGSGTAVGPPIGTLPPVVPSSGPTPDIAPPPVTATVSPSPAPVVAYGDPAGLVQSSPHRYGLPTALALLAAVGVLSLILRLLLAWGAERDRW